MSRDISDICLEIGKTLAYSGVLPEVFNKVNGLLDEIIQVKDEIYLQGRTDQKHEDLASYIVLRGLIKLAMELNDIPEKFYDLVEGYLKKYF